MDKETQAGQMHCYADAGRKHFYLNFFFFCWDWYERTDVEAMVGRDFYRMTWEHQRPEAAESRSRHEFSTGTAKDTNCWFRRTTSDPWGLDLGSSSWSPAASDFPCLASVSLNGISVICGQKKFCHCSVTQSCPTLATPWTTTCQASLSFTISLSLLKLMPTESVMPSNHLILCCPLLLLPSIFPSIRVFSNELALCIRWQKYWDSASASVLPMKILGWFPLEWTGLISLLSKGLSRVFSSTTVQKHQFFGAQPSLLSNSHLHTGPLGNHSFDFCWAFVGKVMSLLFNTLSKFVIALLTRNLTKKL